MVGVTTGCYSSIYIAAPILLWMVGEPKPHEVQQHEAASAARAADARA
jgi:preprotein translocase subunit SecF